MYCDQARWDASAATWHWTHCQWPLNYCHLTVSATMPLVLWLSLDPFSVWYHHRLLCLERYTLSSTYCLPFIELCEAEVHELIFVFYFFEKLYCRTINYGERVENRRFNNKLTDWTLWVMCGRVLNCSFFIQTICFRVIYVWFYMFTELNLSLDPIRVHYCSFADNDDGISCVSSGFCDTTKILILSTHNPEFFIFSNQFSSSHSLKVKKIDNLNVWHFRMERKFAGTEHSSNINFNCI